MKQFEFLPHTSEAGFEAFGKDLNEVFANSGIAMVSLMTDHKKIKTKSSKKLVKRAKDIESLLYDFLEEILFLLETKNFIVGKIENMIIKGDKNGLQLHCTVLGDNYKNYEFNLHVKSPTYHNMAVEKVKRRYKSRVFVDV